MSPVLEMSPESVSVVESIQETDPTLFDQFDTPETTPDVIPETTPEIVPDTVTVTVADVSISETPTVEIEPIAPEPTSVLTIESVTAATSSIPATPPVLPDIGLIVPPTIASLQKDASLMSQIQQVQPHTSHKKTIILVLLAIFLIGV